MNNLRMTAKQMDMVGACYPLSRIEELWAGRESLSALDILDLDIPDVDKLWGVLREDLIPANTLHELACRFAETALKAEREAGREPDARSLAAIEAKRAWLRGEINDNQLSAASSAAWSATNSVAWSATNSAAWSTAWSATSSAASSAARSAASSAARYVQVGIVRDILSEMQIENTYCM